MPHTCYTDFGEVVYHGSPHNFDKFSLLKIGTGEGAQVFGWGIYFAKNVEVAKGYRKTLTHTGLLFDGELVDPDSPPSDWPEDARAWHNVVTDLEDATVDDAQFAVQQVIKQQPGYSPANVWLEENKTLFSYKALGGCLYEVEIPDDDDELLDYDLPLDRQPPKVQKALLSLGIEIPQAPKVTPKQLEARVRRHLDSKELAYLARQDLVTREIARRAKVALEEGRLAQWAQTKIGQDFIYPHIFKLSYRTGESAYQELTMEERRRGVEMSEAPKLASEKLLAAGIPGLKYLDQNSRDEEVEERTHNYVIWDEARIKLVKKSC